MTVGERYEGSLTVQCGGDVLRVSGRGTECRSPPALCPVPVRVGPRPVWTRSDLTGARGTSA